MAETARLTAMVDEWRAGLTPACHDWPVTDEDRTAVAQLPALPDDELAAARHVHDLIYRWQRGRCAVCGGGRSGELVLDHDHVTALVRGWLCRGCNVSEAHSDGGNFAKYRDRPPAVMLGVTARYVDPWYGLAEPRESHAQWFARALENEPPPVT
ncbi:endonuclease domain-containing protein [Micromonospora sp. NPDC049089]|uniref:endonuclease domain-containing protein n=1 Tax=Micromonospora sp. NPDC049089 TaxID=3155496 RepID=UPI0033F0EA42